MKLVNNMIALGLLVGGAFAITPALAADAIEMEIAPQEQTVAAKPAKVLKDLFLKDDAQCTECHDEADAPGLLAIGKTRHGTTADERNPTCTSCHGESKEHKDHKGKEKPPHTDRNFNKDTKTSAADRNAACLTCHQGGKHISWQSSTHATRGVACSSCHEIHTPHDKVRDKTAQTEVCFNCHKQQRTEIRKQSHHPILEGKMSCSSCHEVHGDNPKQLVKSSTNDTCFTCHMEKRGPFVHNHQPVSEDCGICHNPHGTNVDNLLKTRAPFLCQQCHSHTSHPGQAAGLPSGQGTASAGRTTSTSFLGTVGRGCMSCHTNIHGGNSTVNSGTAGRFRR